MTWITSAKESPNYQSSGWASAETSYGRQSPISN